MFSPIGRMERAGLERVPGHRRARHTGGRGISVVLLQVPPPTGRGERDSTGVERRGEGGVGA